MILLRTVRGMEPAKVNALLVWRAQTPLFLLHINMKALPVYNKSGVPESGIVSMFTSPLACRSFVRLPEGDDGTLLAGRDQSWENKETIMMCFH